MKLSDADLQKVTDWIKTKCGEMHCVCCGSGSWAITGISTLPIGFDIHTSRFHYHEGLPQIAIACTHCAHLVYFSTAMMGFKPDEPTAASP